MKNVVSMGIAAALATAATAVASPVLHIDVNSINAQSQVSGVNAAFGGLNATGSVVFSANGGSVVALESLPAIGGAATPLGLTSPLTNFSGQINLANGVVTGGTMRVDVASGDFYQTSITPNSGSVGTFVGGGYTIQGLTFNGQFQDALFGNVNIAQWFGQTLGGSFLQFNFNPNANGSSAADVDIYVQAVPLPSAALAGLSTLAGLGLTGYVRSRRR
jgi:hypothetical protein